MDGLINHFKLKRIRSLKRYSTKNVSEATGISMGAITSIENGVRTNAELKTILALCSFYDITVFDILSKKHSKQMIQRFLNELCEAKVINVNSAANIYEYYGF